MFKTAVKILDNVNLSPMDDRVIEALVIIMWITVIFVKLGLI